MIAPPDHVKRYRSAAERFLRPLIATFFARECPKLFGPVLCEKLAEELVALFDAVSPPRSSIRPGQMLWVALDARTRGDSPRRRLVPVLLDLVSEEDVQRLASGAPRAQVTGDAIARMIRQAYEQGGILSSRDLGLITLRQPGAASQARMLYEAGQRCTLPHTGALHDMGSCVTHKAQIIRKVIHEKKDPVAVARECRHTQRAVDRYLSDYQRVSTLYRLGNDEDFIHLVTRIARHVIRQYIKLIRENEL